MEKITSFTIDHNKLVPGLYVSRKDHVEGAVITTFDIRMTNPNEEPVMNTAEMHTIEHLAATFLRNHSVYGKKIYLFWSNGMSYRFLSASCRRLPVLRHCRSDAGTFCIYCRLLR